MKPHPATMIAEWLDTSRRFTTFRRLVKESGEIDAPRDELAAAHQSQMNGNNICPPYKFQKRKKVIYRDKDKKK